MKDGAITWHSRIDPNAENSRDISIGGETSG